MLNLITNADMRAADAFTINKYKIASTQLMEQAALAFVDEFCKMYTCETPISVITGKGNNGGDGLAIARILYSKGYEKIKVYTIDLFKNESDDFIQNKIQLINSGIEINSIQTIQDFPLQLGVVIDAILGTGFNKALSSDFIKIFDYINTHSEEIISVDCPSGLNTDNYKIENYEVIRAHKTISFQRPKLIFTLPESVLASASFTFVDIGLDEEFIQKYESSYFWIQESDIQSKLKKRKPFTHKGTYGHLLVIAGTAETLGATILCSRSALFTGVGLVTVAFEPTHFPTLNVAQPELMTIDIDNITTVDFSAFKTMAIGPGLGKTEKAKSKLEFILSINKPMVIDADALNLIAENKWYSKIPKQSILTPHIKEFDRLFGAHHYWVDRIETAKLKAKELDCVIVLKNQYTYIVAPNDKVYINPTGNPSMAQGGMGDVLTGCIAGFFTRGFSLVDAAILGCYIHGKTGDNLSNEYEVTPPSLIIPHLSKTMATLVS